MQEKKKKFLSMRILSGNNSLYFYEGYNVNIDTVKREKIILSTINKYTEENNIKRIDFLR